MLVLLHRVAGKQNGVRTWPPGRSVGWDIHRQGRDFAVCRGGAADETAIPAGLRRRMGKLERLAVRCALGVLGTESTDELIFCSRYGNLETLLSLLRGIACDQLVSPMAFSGSVHNATPGYIGQIRGERIRHTALA